MFLVFFCLFFLFLFYVFFFFFSSRRRHTRYIGDWSSDVCSSDLSRRKRGEAHMDLRYPSVAPPSTGSAIPVMKLADGDARNRIASAISSGVAIRPTRCMAACCWRTAAGSGSVSAHSRISGVSTPAGQTQLTRMPSGASSIASDFVIATRPPLLAEYTAPASWPTSPVIDATDTIAPRDRRSADSAARTQR